VVASTYGSGATFFLYQILNPTAKSLRDAPTGGKGRPTLVKKLVDAVNADLATQREILRGKLLLDHATFDFLVIPCWL
jgi:hypothetical protein|tara:strand:- start:122 stop:355 length:234 start_codon:yes stop_codon:yes gene_type:complete